MKRIQPYYYIVVLASLFLLSGLVLFAVQLFPAAESNGITVDPQVNGQGEALYDLWFTSVGIYDLSVDHALSSILFSADNNTKPPPYPPFPPGPFSLSSAPPPPPPAPKKILAERS